MSVTTEPAGVVEEETLAEARTRGELSPMRAAAFGGLCVVLGALTVFAFGFGSNSGVSTTFVLDRDPAIDFAVPSRTTPILLGLISAAVGALVITRVLKRRIYLVLAVVLALFVFSLLTWAAGGADTSLLGLLQGAIIRSIPLALGALAGVLCERAGVINIAIEGMMLAAAFVGSLVASSADNLWVGMAGGIGIGIVFGYLLAVLSIRYVVDQIIGGTVLNIFALGVTSFLAAKVLQEYQNLNEPGTFRPIDIPGLVEIPFFGPLLFNNSVFVYLMFILVGVVWFALTRTRWGLRLRAVGEHPRAADTVGINVLRTRYVAVLLGGAMAGLAGTFFSLGSAGGFEEEMTAGKGFIALAALIFGRWHPVGALCAALVFGFAEELQARLALLGTPIPSEFLLMTPYIVTIIVVAGLVGRARPPAADGLPYRKQ